MIKIHFSVDDTIQIFHFLYKYKDSVDSIFECRILDLMRDLHYKYNIKCSFYCYYEDNNVKLSDVSNIFADEFKANSDWLKFGFHSKNSISNYNSDDVLYADFVQTTSELKRIFQGDDNITNILRIHFFAGKNKNDIDEIAKYGVKTLLTADDDRKSYYFNTPFFNKEFYDGSNGINFIPTLIRIEKSDDIMTSIKNKIDILDDNQILTIFTHEWLLQKVEMKKKLYTVFDYLNGVGLKEYINMSI